MTLTCLGILILTLGVPPGPGEGSGSPTTDRLVTARIERRIVKTFDFDERKLGNYEDVPMNWRRLIGPGYPRFLEPAFDDEVGHDAPPSLRLTINGGSVGAHYLAKDIPVNPDSDYRITAWIRSAELAHARASITAYFLDHACRKITDTERHSCSVGGKSENDVWTAVTVDLPGGLVEAAWIGLTCSLDQAAETTPRSDDPRPVNYRDVHGTAWFDDLSVIRLPQATLELRAPAPSFSTDQAVECLARVVDPDGVGLRAQLEVFDADERLCQTHAIGVVRASREATGIALDDLDAGRYTARLTVSADSQEIISLRRSFIRIRHDLADAIASRSPHKEDVRLASAHGGSNRRSHGFGLLMDVPPSGRAEITEHLLQAISPGAIKIPIWGDDTTDEAIVRGDAGLNQLLRITHDLDIPVVGILAAPPRSLALQESGPHRTLAEVLSSPAEEWRPYLALPLARYGGQVAAWQIGGDDEGPSAEDPRLPQAIAGLRAELRPLLGVPILVAPVHAEMRVPIPRAVDIVSVTVPWHIAAGRLAELLADPANSGDHRWVSLQNPPPDRYPRRARLAEFARRLIVARGSGAERVFVPQPWSVETKDARTVVEPAEEIILLRTLAQSLDGLTPRSTFWLDHGTQAWLFEDESSGWALIAAWTDGDEPGPRRIVVDLGTEAKRIDLWGNAAAPPTVQAEREIALEAMPVLIGPVPLWRARMLAGFTLDDPVLQVTVEQSHRTLRLTNPTAQSMHGTLRLAAPVGWSVQPAKCAIELAAGESAALPVSFRLPANQAIGDYALVGRLTFDGPDGGEVTLRAPLRVRCPGLDVGVLTDVDGRRLKVVQRVTNLTAETVSLRSSLIGPGVSADAQTIANLAPGQTAVREYCIDDARPLRGGCLRVSAQQIGGPLRCNHVIRFDDTPSTDPTVR